MKISQLKPGQFVTKSGKKYEYQGVKKVRGVIAVTEKIVFQGGKPEDKLLYPLTDGSKTLESENMIFIEQINFKKGDKIRIKDNLMEELIKAGFDQKEMRDFVNKFKGTEQTALDVYNEDDQKWITVELCCEVPVSACELIND